MIAIMIGTETMSVTSDQPIPDIIMEKIEGAIRQMLSHRMKGLTKGGVEAACIRCNRFCTVMIKTCFRSSKRRRGIIFRAFLYVRDWVRHVGKAGSKIAREAFGTIKVTLAVKPSFRLLPAGDPAMN
jgi:hypothetical protein